MHNSTTALEDNVVVPPNIKHRVTTCPGIPLLGIYPSEMKANIHTKTCNECLKEYDHNSQRKQPNNQTDQINKKMWYGHKMKYYSAVKRNEVLIHATARMNL